jgi:hypothetical protein
MNPLRIASGNTGSTDAGRESACGTFSGAAIVVLVVLDTVGGSYLWWLLDYTPPRVASRAEQSKTASVR